MEPKLNSISDQTSSDKDLPNTKNTTQRDSHGLSESTTSPIELMRKSKLCSVSSKCQLLLKTELNSSMLMLMLLQSTGLPREPSPQLRIKDNADHAGHSQPLVVLKVPTSSRLDNSFLFPSKTLLTAHG